MKESLNILDLFSRAAEKYPHKTAIVYKNIGISYSELQRQVEQTASFFMAKGIAKGDRVMVFVPMSIDLYRIVLSLFKIGATAVFIDEWVDKKRLKECCRVAKCKAFVGVLKVRIFACFFSDLKKIPIKLGNRYAGGLYAKVKSPSIISSDTALITFTTGSTGTPKAAERTHGFLYEQFKALTEKIDPQPEDVDMPLLPIVLLINLGIGCTSVIADFKPNKPESLNPEKIIGQIKYYDVTRLVSSPFVIKQLSKYIIEREIGITTLKKIFTGGAPVFPGEAELYIRAFPGCDIEIIYGSTEAEPISSINAKELIAEKANTIKNGLKVGIPYRKAEVRIIKISKGPIECTDEKDFQELLLAPGEIGEIVVSGPHVLRKYFNNEQALAQNKIFVDDKCWHRTGDSGLLDDLGVIYLTGRCSTLIHYKGKIIAPFIYENYFQSIEGVEMGTIVEIDGRLMALIELQPRAVKKTIISEIRGADIEVDEIKFIKIPRDPRHNSKIDYEKLKEHV